MLKLNDPSLLRHQCFIDGQWRDGTAQIDVTNPANGQLVGTVPRFGNVETRPSHRSRPPRLAGLASQDRQGTRRVTAPMV
jgi:hypothetical protein